MSPLSCISCAVAFPAPADHRAHFRSDHHRYNLKRRIAGLSPVSAAVFAQKLADSTPESHVSRCEPCRKTYATENAYRSHLDSKKHRDAARNPPPCPRQPVPVPVPADEPPLSSTDCLFCTATFPVIQDNLAHMSSVHSFFVPDAEYLVDLAGLIAYLAEKIAVANVCIYCSGRGRELHTIDAVRKHMIDKGHCKIAYDTEADKLEISDHYDFTSSYPPGPSSSNDIDDDDGWEDDDESSVHLPDNQLAYGDTEYELVLASGARIGHRSMMRYYAQSFHGIPVHPQDQNSGKALVRRLLADKNSALVPRKAGFGAFGQGTQVVRARNKGEAREAGRHIREFRDQRRKDDFRTKVAFVHNNQKHFRDPLLQ